jgi:hypothetical protein
LQAFSGFPRSLTALFSKARQQRFAGAAPGENLKRILNERRIEVNSWNEILIVIGPGGLLGDVKGNRAFVSYRSTCGTNWDTSIAFLLDAVLLPFFAVEN